MRCRSIESCRSSRTSLPTQPGWWGSGRSTRRPRWGNTRRSRTPRSTRSSASGRTPVVVGGTGLYLRAALADLDLPPAPAPGARRAVGGALRRERPGGGARASRRDRPRGRRGGASRTTGAASCARWSSPRPVRRSRRRSDRLWAGEPRHPTVVVGLDVPKAVLDERIAERTRAMFERRRPGRGSARARRPDLGDRAKDDGHRRDRDASAGRGAAPHSSRARGGMRAISASGCGESPASLWSTATARWARSPMTSSRWHAHGNVYLVSDDDALTPERVREQAREPTESCRCCVSTATRSRS